MTQEREPEIRRPHQVCEMLVRLEQERDQARSDVRRNTGVWQMVEAEKDARITQLEQERACLVAPEELRQWRDRAEAAEARAKELEATLNHVDLVPIASLVAVESRLQLLERDAHRVQRTCEERERNRTESDEFWRRGHAETEAEIVRCRLQLDEAHATIARLEQERDDLTKRAEACLADCILTQEGEQEECSRANDAEVRLAAVTKALRRLRGDIRGVQQSEPPHRMILAQHTVETLRQADAAIRLGEGPGDKEGT